VENGVIDTIFLARIPAEAHLQKDLTLQKEDSKVNPVRELSLNGVKIPESIRGEKEVVEKNLIL